MTVLYWFKSKIPNRDKLFVTAFGLGGKKTAYPNQEI